MRRGKGGKKYERKGEGTIITISRGKKSISLPAKKKSRGTSREGGKKNAKGRLFRSEGRLQCYRKGREKALTNWRKRKILKYIGGGSAPRELIESRRRAG